MTSDGGAGPGDLLRPLVPLGTAVWRRLKPVLAQRKAAREPRSRTPGIIEQDIDLVLDRLAGVREQDEWWQRLCAWAGSALVRTDFFQIESVRDWLRDPESRTRLRALASAGLLARELKSVPDEFGAAIERYSHHTGEHRSRGEDATRVVVGILLAGLYAPLDASGRTLLAAIQTLGTDTAAIRHMLEQKHDGLSSRQLRDKRVDLLPADLTDFEGREAQIETLTTALRGGGQAAITAIDGMGGVGKSALAIHVARALAAEIAPDGVLYVEAGGVSERPLSALDAMAEVIASFDPKAPKPTSEREAIAGFRAVLDGKRVLLLLDNAKDAGTVAPLFEQRPPACAILVTSREKIVWPGVVPVPLEEMTPDEARTLLRSIVGQARASDAELDEIARRCGRLPLALRVAGTFLVRHANWPVQAYLTALADERGRLAKLKLRGLPKLDVAAVLGFSARQLAEEDRPLAERWQTLAVFVESFDLAAAAAIWQLGADQALDGLGALIARSMVRFDLETDRYRLHDLMRDVARVPLKGQDEAALDARLEAARAQHAQHYCDGLAAAGELYLLGGDRALAGLALYDLEQRNIAAGQTWAALRAETNRTAAALAAAFGETLGATLVLSIRLRPHEHIDWLEAQRMACVILGDKQREGTALGNLGVAYSKDGKRQRAITSHKQHLEIAREIGDHRGEANALGNLGPYCKPRQAIEYFEKQLAITREIGDRYGESRALGNLGIAWQLLGEPERALEYLRQQLTSTRRKNGDPVGEAHALFNMALLLHGVGKPEDAVRQVHEALAIVEAIGAEDLVAKARAQLAEWGAEDGRS